MVFKKISDLLSLTRPLEWSKTFANMVLGYFTALIVLKATGTIDLQLFAAAFIIIGPLFWGSLYILNDWTDWRNDQKHAAKKERAIAAGKIKPAHGLAFGVFLLFVSFGFAFKLNNPLLLVCMALMLVNQWFYTMEPFYLKRRVFWDMTSGGIINPLLRFVCGWALVSQSLSNIPLSMLVFVIAIQYVFYSLFRASTREIEKEIGFKSSVVVFSEKTVIGTALLAFLIAVLAYCLACTTIIPEKFLIPLLLSGFVLPHYMKGIENPEHIQFKKMKTLVYLHFFGFAVLFAAMYFV